MPVDVSKLFDRGRIALERGNYDYAMDIFTQILHINPSHLDSRKALREVQKRKFQDAGMPSSAKYLCWVKGIGSLLKLFIMSLLKRYDDAIEACEGLLKHYPSSKYVNFKLAKLCTYQGYTDVAIWVFEELRKENPDNVRILRCLGDLYKKKNDAKNAAECYERVIQLDPTDREAQQSLRDIAAIRTMIEGRWTDAGKEGGYRKMLRDEQKAQDLEAAQAVLRTSDDVRKNIERVKRDIENDPRNKRYWAQLGDLYRSIKEFEQAREAYNKAREIDPNDFSIVEKLGDLRILEYDTELGEVRQKLQQSPDDQTLKVKLGQLSKERLEFAIQEYQKRVKARPTDLPAHFTLGELLFEAGRIREAAQHYQQAVNDPRNRRKACHKLGLCFIQQGLLELAVSQLEKAAQGVSLTTSETKEYVYVLADSYEKLGNVEKALENFKRIVEVDLNYRDVTERINHLLRKQRGNTAGTSS